MVWEDLSLNNIKPTRKLSIFLRYFSFVNYSISRNFRFWDNRNLVYNVFFLFHLWPFLKNFAYLKPSSPLWISKTYVYWHIEFDGWKILNLTWFSLEKKLFNVQQYLFQFTNFIARKRFIISNSLPFQWNTQQNPISIVRNFPRDLITFAIETSWKSYDMYHPIWYIIE